MADAAQGFSWKISVIRQLEVLRFAKDWFLLKGDGSKKMKTEFYKQSFQRSKDVEPQLVGFSDDERKSWMKEHKGEFTKWRREHEGLITGRNRLLMLYHVVSSSVVLYTDLIIFV